MERKKTNHNEENIIDKSQCPYRKSQQMKTKSIQTKK